MKSFCIFITSLIPFFALCQTSFDKEIYLDSLSVQTDFEKAVYTRIIKDYGTIQEEYLFTDYYISGKIQKMGKSKNRDYLLETGAFAYFYENGKRKKIINYEESIPKGNYFSWYESGDKKEIGEYLINEKEKRETGLLMIMQFWDENCNQKVIDGNGYYKEEDVEAKTISNGKLINGLKDSIWVGIDRTRNTSFVEEYDNGKLLSGTTTDSLGISYPYRVAVVKPKPKNGIEAFYQYIARNFIIPENLSNVHGKVFISFVIEKNGQVGDVRIVRSIHPTLDMEAARLLYHSPLWEPGILRGIPCRVKYSLPISFGGQ